MRPCQAAPGIGDDDIHAAEFFRDRIEGAAHIGGIRHVAAKRQRVAADLFRNAYAAVLVAVEHGHFRALFGKRFGGRRADARAAAGDDRDLARQRLLGGLAELGLFQRPIFDVELVFLGNRLIAAHAFGGAHRLDRVFGDVGGDGRILRRCAEAEQADARHQHHARVRIELLLDAVQPRIVAREIFVVARDEGIDRLRAPTRPIDRACLLSGAGTISGQFLVRMV